MRGTSAVVGLGNGALNTNVLVSDAAQVIALAPQPQGYPGSLMGAIAVIRQALLDAKWYRDANAAYAKKPGGAARPPVKIGPPELPKCESQSSNSTPRRMPCSEQLSWTERMKRRSAA